ncbi:MAG TPA: hypothetical protein VFS67_25815 [Polyangiaceae bacterium]|nr:hypothetical protein [Polyangiaceae bacterium]
MMQQLIRALAALGAALVFAGCGSPDPGADDVAAVPSPSCTAPGEIEAQYANSEGYDPAGCTRTERMARVRGVVQIEAPDAYPTVDVLGVKDRAAASEGDFGSAQQAVQIGFGLGGRVDVTGQGEIIDATGAPCDVDVNWTINDPLLGNCLIPNDPHGTSWAVWPGYDTLTYLYMTQRMSEAWDSWVRPASICGHSNSPASNGIRSAASAHQLTGVNNDSWTRYFLASVPIFPVFDNGQSEYIGRAMPDIETAVPKTPIRFGDRYWGWKYAGIGVNHSMLEGIKQDACVDPNDPNRLTRLNNAYDFVLAHELGHLWGWPHTPFSDGIMRPSEFISCEEIFALTPPASRGMPNEFEVLSTNDTRSTSGFSVVLEFVNEPACTIPLSSLPTSSHREVYPLE